MQKVLKCAATLAVMAMTGCASGHLVNRGEKVGTVIKLADQGYWWKTTETEVVRGGMNGGNGSFSTTPLHATVNDPGIRAKLQDAFDKQYEVVVTYDDIYCWTSISSESDCVFVTSVRPLRQQ